MSIRVFSTTTSMIYVTRNMLSATEECHRPSGNCRGISHYLESGHPECKLLMHRPVGQMRHDYRTWGGLWQDGVEMDTKWTPRQPNPLTAPKPRCRLSKIYVLLRSSSSRMWQINEC